MAKDLNKEQSVATQDLKDVGVVNQQDLTAGTVDQQNQDVLADGTTKDKTVKYSEFEKANKAKNEAEESRKVAEEQAAHAQRQLELMQIANASPQQAPKSSAEQALADLGIAAEDLFGENQIRFLARKDQIDAQKAQQQQMVNSIRQFVVSHPDLNTVVGSVNPATGGITAPSAEVLALVAKKPYLAGATTEMLYNSVIQEREFSELQKTVAATKEHQNRQDVDNETQPLGGSAAGVGGGSGDIKQSLLSREEMVELERQVANS